MKIQQHIDAALWPYLRLRWVYIAIQTVYVLALAATVVVGTPWWFVGDLVAMVVVIVIIGSRERFLVWRNLNVRRSVR